MTAQDIKKSILQLAVQGRLVPQDQREETASELLKRVKRFRENAISNGTLSVDKKHTAEPIVEDDIPYDLPSSWEWVRFADIVIFNSGKTPARQDAASWSNGVCPWVSIADMVADGITFDTKEKISEKAISESFSGKISPIGTMIMSFKLTIGKMSILGIEAVHNEAIISIFPTAERNDEDAIKAYLFKVLPLIAVTGDSKNAVKGKTLNAASISNLMIPLPPLAEQKRIVAKIEELMPLIEEYDEIERRLSKLNGEFPDKLCKAVLQQAVQGKLTERDPSDEPASELLKRIRAEKAKLLAEGKIKKEKLLPPITEEEKPFDIPDTWEWVKLGEIITGTSAGKSPQCLEQPRQKNEWGVIKTTAIQNGYFLHTENKVLSKDFLIKEEYIVQIGDLLITRAGPKNRTGIMCVVDEQPYQLILSDKTVRLAYLRDYVDPHYIVHALNSPAMQFVMSSFMTGMAESQVNISQNKMKDFILPLPPLAEQKRIVARVEELLAVCDGLK